MHSLSWEANSSLAIQETSRLLWNHKFYYRINKESPLRPIPK
jgi:hypothetical protein